jgi:hypothetical protein
MLRKIATALVIVAVALLGYPHDLAYPIAEAGEAMAAADCGCHDADDDCGKPVAKQCDAQAGCALRCAPCQAVGLTPAPAQVVPSPDRRAVAIDFTAPPSLSSSPPLRPPRSSILA